MEAKTLRELRAAMMSGQFALAYYVHGDDEYRKDELMRSLTNAVVDAPTRDFNLDMFRGSDVSPEHVESLLHTPPMMATRRAVIVRDTGALKKDARATLERYLERPSPDSVLVLVALAGTKEEKAFAGLAVSVAVERLSGEALAAWMVRHAHDVHGVTLAPVVQAALLQAVGPDTVQLAAELDKLVSYVQGEPLTVEAVAAVVGTRHEASISHLLDAVAARDLPAALGVIEAVLAQPKVNAVTVIMALAVQALALSWGVYARERGVPAYRMHGEYFTLLKDTGAFPMRAWGDATKAWARYLPRWDRISADAALRALRLADQGAKDTRLASDEQLLSTLVCSMCVPHGPVAAAR